MRISRKSSVVASVATILFCASVAGGVGTIVTTCATIDSGTAANKGTVTIDECAPPATPPVKPSLGVISTQGAIDGPLPAKPSTGDGSLGAVALSTDLTLTGTTYNYTDFDIQAGATITYDDSVTILATGSVRIAGRIETGGLGIGGGDITIIAGDEIIVFSMDGAPVTGVVANGAGNITLEADRVEMGVQLLAPAGTPEPAVAEVRTPAGDIVIRSHGAPTGLNAIDIEDSELRSTDTGNVLIQSSTIVDVFTTFIETTTGSSITQAFGGDVTFSSTEVTTMNSETVIEASTFVEVLAGSLVRAFFGDTCVEAFGGDVTVDESTVSGNDGGAISAPTGTGSVVVAASGNVRLNDDAVVVSEGTGGIRVTAHAGDVSLENPGATNSSVVECTRQGGVLVEAADDVFVAGDSYLRAQDSDLVVRAFGGDVELEGTPQFDAVDAGVDVGASAGIIAVQDTGGLSAVLAGPAPEFDANGGAIRLIAGSAGIDLQAYVDAIGSDIYMQCEGDISLEGTAEASGGGNVSMISENGDILVVDAMVMTASGSIPTVTGDVLLESFGGSGALIDATNATIVSGDAPTGTSGDVSLLIHDTGTIQSFVLPKTVKVKINENKPEKSKVNAAGFFDTGPDATPLGGPATVTVGDLQYSAVLEPNKKGTAFLFKTGGVKLQIKPAGSGSSRAKFRLTITDDFEGNVPDEGDITLRFDTAAANGEGTVGLENGKYKLGKRRGLLSSPNVFPFKIKQVHKGDGKDVLSILAGLATEGGDAGHGTGRDDLAGRRVRGHGPGRRLHSQG